MVEITTSQITPLNWKRGVEDRYPSVNDASLKWGPYNLTTDGEVLSGMVCGIRTGTGNQVVRANGTPFHGIFFTEYSSALDEKAGGAPPTVIVGPALLFIRKSALNAASAYVANGNTAFLTSAAGRLVPVAVDATTGATTTPANAIVGKCQEVLPDGIMFRLNVATT